MPYMTFSRKPHLKNSHIPELFTISILDEWALSTKSKPSKEHFPINLLDISLCLRFCFPEYPTSKPTFLYSDF